VAIRSTRAAWRRSGSSSSGIVESLYDHPAADDPALREAMRALTPALETKLSGPALCL
jgi:hypothetical protein